MKKVLLLSGGFDSLLISEYKRENIHHFVYIDYGHRFRDRELEVLRKWQDYSGRFVEMLNLPDLKDKDGFFFGRNLRFMIAVRERYVEDNILVYFGNNADDNYNDNTREFLARTEKVINDSYPKTMRIICPLENNTKEEIVRMYQESDLYKAGIIPYFCDSGQIEPCRKCHSCQAMIDAGVL